MSDWIAWVKLAMVACGSFLVSTGASIEPSEAVWIMAIAGSLLGVAIDEDRTVSRIIVHAIMGILVAIACAWIIDFISHLPRPPVALLVGIGGARVTVTAVRATEAQIERDGVFQVLKSVIFRRGK